MSSLRVLVIDDSGALRGLCQTIEECGYAVVSGPVETDGALVLARRLRPDLVLVPAELPEAASLSNSLSRDRVAPVVWASRGGSRDLVERAKGARVAAVVRAEAGVFDLRAALELAVASFQDQRHLEREVAKLEETLKARKVVERAKGLLMEQYGLKESEAYGRMRQLAMDHRKSLREIAETILTVSDLGGPNTR